MALRGGAREGSGRKKKIKPPTEAELTGVVVVDGVKTPLEYALGIMNDNTQDEARRDRMAVAALPFVHMKKGEGGKKEQLAESANKVGSGKFAAASPPQLRAVK